MTYKDLIKTGIAGLDAQSRCSLLGCSHAPLLGQNLEASYLGRLRKSTAGMWDHNAMGLDAFTPFTPYSGIKESLLTLTEQQRQEESRKAIGYWGGQLVYQDFMRARAKEAIAMLKTTRLYYR